MAKLDLRALEKLEFFELEEDRFPAVALARECLREGPSASAVFNAANELAVEAFLQGQLKFTEITPFVRRVVNEERFAFPQSFSSLYVVLSELAAAISKRLK